MLTVNAILWALDICATDEDDTGVQNAEVRSPAVPSTKTLRSAMRVPRSSSVAKAKRVTFAGVANAHKPRQNSQACVHMPLMNAGRYVKPMTLSNVSIFPVGAEPQHAKLRRSPSSDSLMLSDSN